MPKTTPDENESTDQNRESNRLDQSKFDYSEEIKGTAKFLDFNHLQYEESLKKEKLEEEKGVRKTDEEILEERTNQKSYTRNEEDLEENSRTPYRDDDEVMTDDTGPGRMG